MSMNFSSQDEKQYTKVQFLYKPCSVAIKLRFGLGKGLSWQSACLVCLKHNVQFQVPYILG